MKKIIISTLLLALVVTGCSKVEKKKNLTIEEAKAKALTFINDSLMQPGNSAEIKEIVEEGDLYKLKVSANGQEIDSYLTKDGSKFFPQVMDVEEVTKEVAASKAETGTPAAGAETASTAPKTDSPKVELFVMAFCPYGVQAEATMAPVYELLKNKADINIRFIASMPEGSSDISGVKSLHGAIEGIEDARQMCATKNYSKDVLWKYVKELNEKCYPIYRNGEAEYKTCWESAAKNAGMSVDKLDSCVAGEGAAMIKADDTIAKGYGVSGSPSLVINGVKVNATRTEEGYKKAICDAFNTAPAECEKTLAGASAATAPAAGGCGN